MISNLITLQPENREVLQSSPLKTNQRIRYANGQIKVEKLQNNKVFLSLVKNYNQINKNNVEVFKSVFPSLNINNDVIIDIVNGFKNGVTIEVEV